MYIAEGDELCAVMPYFTGLRRCFDGVKCGKTKCA